ncbi:MAG: zinc ABC transporter substrate-binding protein [Bdellovibrionales bacterium]|nr:zinc ABC transporter substrate-binding protein [Bdellovibrionales bacterium]
MKTDITFGVLSVLTALLVHSEAQAAPLEVMTSLADVQAVVAAIGGSEVHVQSFLTGVEDPHFVDASPRFVQQAIKADLVCAMGLDLESGWLPRVLARSGNAAIQPGGKGYCELSSTVDVLEKSEAGSDRSKGDIHAGGNPHFNLSPRALAQASTAVLEALIRLRPEMATTFKKNREAFVKEMTEIEETTRLKLKPLIERSAKEPVVIEYHREFLYFFSLYGIKSLGSIEEKPGLSPSAAHLANIALQSKTAGIKVAIASQTAPHKHLARFTELSGIPHKTVYTMLQTERGAKDGPTRFRDAQEQITKALLE